MNKIVTGLLMIGLVVGVALSAPEPGPGIRLCLGGNFALLTMEGGDSAFMAGAALRADLGLGPVFFVAPEVAAGLGGWSAGGTLNAHVSVFYAGAGALVLDATKGGASGEWGTNAFLKMHVGMRNSRNYLALSALFGSYIKGFGVSIGYVF